MLSPSLTLSFLGSKSKSKFYKYKFLYLFLLFPSNVLNLKDFKEIVCNIPLLKVILLMKYTNFLTCANLASYFLQSQSLRCRYIDFLSVSLTS